LLRSSSLAAHAAFHLFFFNPIVAALFVLVPVALVSLLFWLENPWVVILMLIVLPDLESGWHRVGVHPCNVAPAPEIEADTECADSHIGQIHSG